MFEKITPNIACALIIAVSATALAAALTSQYGFGLQPCELCIYQRWPYAIAIGLGLMGLMFPALVNWFIGLSGVTFLFNSGLAFFHAGVEYKWWKGLAGCSTPDMSGSIEELMERIKNAAVTRCDEPAWSLFGVSMAGYNVIACAILAAACFYYLYHRRKS